MDPALRARLPAAALPWWDRIAALDALIRVALDPQAEATGLDALAIERLECIERFCAAFPLEPGTATLRAEALRALLSGNAALVEASGDALGLAAGNSVESARQRRAISAYHAQDDSA